ncbi:MAG: ABC transporter ATP-binding protein [Alphaproteobacteria bacterium]|nr:ABC transporter ATP-binding protein [Alphaproteobacteria bacterium]
MSNLSVWNFLYKYIKQAKYMVSALLVMFLVASFLMRMQNYLVAEMIGVITNPKLYPDIFATLFKYLMYFAIVILLLSAGDALRRIVEAYFVSFFNARLSKDLFVMTHKHSISFFEEEMSGNISSKVRNILTNVDNMYLNLLFGLTLPIMEIGMCIVFIAFADGTLALLLGVLNLLFLVFTLYFKKQITPYAALKSKLTSEANGVFVDTVTNSVLVKSFANYFFEKHNYFKAVKKSAIAQRKEFLKVAKINWISRSSFDVLYILSYALVFYFWHKYNLSVADVVLVTSLFTTMTNSIRNMGFFASGFAQIFGSIKDGLELLNKPCEVKDKPAAIKLKIKSNDVVFDKITYCYRNNKKIFNKFSLKIQPNQKIGLVGHSGAGKSTLIKLLSRYYDINSGKILIGGKDISEVTQESLRSKIAVIPQESTLFNRSIMENIRYGNPRATDKQVISAAKKAYIHDFIMNLPDKYESKVGERGVMLSGGERQRIAIARAILKNAPILILDEATSSLDSQSELYIQKSLKQLMKNKTVIAIAHRLSTLNEMDELIVLKKGKIVERGTHKQLLEDQGEYYKFYSLQQQK